MKKLLIALVACLTVFSVVNVKAAGTGPVAPSLFNAGEFGLTLSSGVTVNPPDSVRTVPGPVVDDFVERKYCHSENTPDRVIRSEGNRVINLTVGGFWYPTKVLGLEANVPIFRDDNHRLHVEEVQAGLLLRAPLFEKCPVLRHVAPYGGLGTVLNWQGGNTWSYVAKGGLEVHVTRHIRAFGEFQYRNVDFNWNQGSRVVQAGLRLPF